MAKLFVNGLELARFKTLRYEKAYFANGKIFVNRGNGWKVYARVKKGFSVLNVANNAIERQKEWFLARPKFKAFYDEIMKKSTLNRQCILYILESKGTFEDYLKESKYRRFKTVDNAKFSYLYLLFEGMLTEQNELKK